MAGRGLAFAGTRLSVNVDRLLSLRYGSRRDLALHGAAGPIDERGDQLTGILEAHRGVLPQADATSSAGSPRPELRDRERGERGSLLTAHLRPVMRINAGHAHAVRGIGERLSRPTRA